MKCRFISFWLNPMFPKMQNLLAVFPNVLTTLVRTISVCYKLSAINFSKKEK
jgi:hypothetical protein